MIFKDVEVGQTVLVRSLEELNRDYGGTFTMSDCLFGFTIEMDKLFGHELAKVTGVNHDTREVYLNFDDSCANENANRFMFSADMLAWAGMYEEDEDIQPCCASEIEKLLE